MQEKYSGDKLVWDSSLTQKTLEDNNKTLGEMESQGVSITKPTAGIYVRIKPKTKFEELIWVDVAFHTDAKTQKETQYPIRGENPEQDRKIKNILRAIVKPCILVPYQDNGGNESIWIVKQPGKGQSSMASHTSSIRAIKGMLDGWRMVWFENLKIGYCCEVPDSQDAFEDFKFGTFTTSQLLNFAFDDNIIKTIDHDLITTFKGKKH